jgi:hypothetical protein
LTATYLEKVPQRRRKSKLSGWLTLLFLPIVLTTAGCHSGRKATVHVTVHRTAHRKTIEIGRGVRASALLSGVQGVSRGTGAAQLFAIFGRPFTKVSVTFGGQQETCWAYHALQPGTSIDGLDFCLNKAQKVERIGLGSHG